MWGHVRTCGDMWGHVGIQKASNAFTRQSHTFLVLGCPRTTPCRPWIAVRARAIHSPSSLRPPPPSEVRQSRTARVKLMRRSSPGRSGDGPAPAPAREGRPKFCWCSASAVEVRAVAARPGSPEEERPRDGSLRRILRQRLTETSKATPGRKEAEVNTASQNMCRPSLGGDEEQLVAHPQGLEGYLLFPPQPYFLRLPNHGMRAGRPPWHSGGC